MYCCFQEKVVGVWTEPNITQFQTFFFPWTCFVKMEFQATYFLFQLHSQYVIFGLKKRLLEFGLHQPTEPKFQVSESSCVELFCQNGSCKLISLGKVIK